jgi:hypothetical protein
LDKMKKNKLQDSVLYIPLIIWVGFVVWWMLINVAGNGSRDNFTDTYSVVALATFVSGTIVARKWGLFKSRFGSVIGYFAIGLLMQFLGHFIYALYFRLGDVELAYPSIGDLPFLLTGVFYILAIYNLLKLIVVKRSVFKPRYVPVISVIITLILSWLMYVSFLNLAIHDERGIIYSVVNAAYPIIQVFYFLMGIVAILQAKRMAGGKMFLSVSIILAALVVQYAADFSFLYQDYHGTWEAAGSNDFAYLVAYGLMALAILMIERVRVQAVSPAATENAPGSNNG